VTEGKFLKTAETVLESTVLCDYKRYQSDKAVPLCLPRDCHDERLGTSIGRSLGGLRQALTLNDKAETGKDRPNYADAWRVIFCFCCSHLLTTKQHSL
jgi:hypothetical protein